MLVQKLESKSWPYFDFKALLVKGLSSLGRGTEILIMHKALKCNSVIIFASSYLKVILKGFFLGKNKKETDQKASCKKNGTK